MHLNKVPVSYDIMLSSISKTSLDFHAVTRKQVRIVSLEADVRRSYTQVDAAIR